MASARAVWNGLWITSVAVSPGSYLSLSVLTVTVSAGGRCHVTGVSPAMNRSTRTVWVRPTLSAAVTSTR